VIPNPAFTNLPKSFWANIRLISEAVSYTNRSTHQIKIPTKNEIIDAYLSKGLDTSALFNGSVITDFGLRIIDYFDYRASILNNNVQYNLQDAPEAEKNYKLLFDRINPPAHLLPMNKQSGDKKKVAFLTAIVNMIVYENLQGSNFSHDPRNLTLITKDTLPLRTFSRRLDGAFPSTHDPKVIWEIKEYYYTTTFGSRVADGVYETLVDGMELEELFLTENRKVLHYLIVDSKYTWWECGRSYLCRLIDLLHMGYIDVLLFGKEVFSELPDLVKSWKLL